MLKPFINVIKICFWLFVICVIISIILELNCFSCLSLLQQFSIGAACSFIVVVISTYAQYKVEFNKAFSKYISTASSLIFTLQLCQNEFVSDIQIERVFEKLKTEFEDFSKSEAEVLYLKKQNNQKFLDKNSILNSVQLKFLKGQLTSPKDAVRAVMDRDGIICAINAYLEYWPECFEKDNIGMCKTWLEEEKSEDELI